jgi:hypothetical protein
MAESLWSGEKEVKKKEEKRGFAPMGKPHW